MKPDHPIHVFINKTKYDLENPQQTGASLKHLAGIPLGDVLFLQRPAEDEVIGNETSITLQNGAHLHSQPAADYGLLDSISLETGIRPEQVALHATPDNWTTVVISGYELPSGYEPRLVRLLVKLPPLFPEAAPDMFWTHPCVHLSDNRLPRGTSTEHLLGEDWQRFSWHLAPGAWKPGTSTIRDYLRCIRGRFARKD